MSQQLRVFFFAVTIAVFVALCCIYSPSKDEASPCYPDLAASVKKFVFFIGYPRSGHSIVGALMDAHPHVIIAHEFFLFSKFGQLNMIPDRLWKGNLFDELYTKSVADAYKVRMDSKKGYTLSVNDLWQGTYNNYVEVIGDKSGGDATKEYLKDKKEFKRNYAKLRQGLAIPIRIIHVVRNPFDIISTPLVLKEVGIQQYAKFKTDAKLSSAHLNISDDRMRFQIDKFFGMVEAVTEMTKELFGWKNVFEVHNCDLVKNPKKTLSGIFQFLGLETSDHFLELCAAKVFKSVSRSRDAITWSPELREMVEKKMRSYMMFDRYNFTSE